MSLKRLDKKRGPQVFYRILLSGPYNNIKSFRAKQESYLESVCICRIVSFKRRREQIDNYPISVRPIVIGLGASPFLIIRLFKF